MALMVCVTALLVMVDRTASIHPPQVAVRHSCVCVRACVRVCACIRMAHGCVHVLYICILASYEHNS